MYIFRRFKVQCTKLLYFLLAYQPTLFQGYSMISNSDSSASSHGGYEPAPQEDQQRTIEAKRQQLYMESLRRTEAASHWPKEAPPVSVDTGKESAMREQLEKQQEDITRLKASCRQTDGGGTHSQCLTATCNTHTLYNGHNVEISLYSSYTYEHV